MNFFELYELVNEYLLWSEALDTLYAGPYYGNERREVSEAIDFFIEWRGDMERFQQVLCLGCPPDESSEE